MNTDKSLLEAQNQPSCLDAVSSSFIQQLINKYEDKIKSAENLKYKGSGSFSDVPTQSDRERLDVRIYERKTFIKDLKALLNDC